MDLSAVADLASAALNYGRALGNTAFYATCFATGARPAEFETEHRAWVHETHAALHRLTQRPGWDEHLRRAGRDPGEFRVRLESSCRDALRLVTVLTHGDGWGRHVRDWGFGGDRVAAERVDEAGRWFIDLSWALGRVIDSTTTAPPEAPLPDPTTTTSSDPTPTRPEPLGDGDEDALADALVAKGFNLESAFVRVFKGRKRATWQELAETVRPGGSTSWATIKTWITRTKNAIADADPGCRLTFHSTVHGHLIVKRTLPE